MRSLQTERVSDLVFSFIKASRGVSNAAAATQIASLAFNHWAREYTLATDTFTNFNFVMMGLKKESFTSISANKRSCNGFPKHNWSEQKMTENSDYCFAPTCTKKHLLLGLLILNYASAWSQMLWKLLWTRLWCISPGAGRETGFSSSSCGARWVYSIHQPNVNFFFFM